ncbi:MAG: invasion associated locus B family protein [Salinarimonadaceae bacterium]|nr:MAG: invasion associated locus B family protein [Salinarimonadaceae bacterium]
MSFSTRLAQKRAPLGLAAALALAAVSLAPFGAAAQQPASPPVQGAPAPGEEGEQVLVNVVPEPSQTEWTKVCGTDPESNAQICYTTRDFVSEQGEPVLSMAVYDVQAGPDERAKIVRMILPLGLLLQPGIRFAVDQGRPTNGAFAICFPNGCFAEAEIEEAGVNQFKRGNTLNISVQNQIGQVVTFAVPLAGFTAGFDGDPIDPEELEAQQRQLQEELQRRSDEMRQRLEEQAGQGVGAVPAPTPQ